MSLHVYDQIEQGSEQWHAARRGIITASVVGQFITPKTIKVAANDKTRAMAYQLIAERITGHTEDTYVSRDMEAGHFIEPLARDYYSEHYAPATEIGFITNEINGYTAGFSPDGIVGEEGLIEVKLHLPKLHLAIILADQIPTEHIAQCQMGLLITGRDWIDYIASCPGWPVFIKRMRPDPAWFAAITEAVTAFEESAAAMIATYRIATAGRPVTERVNMYEEMEIQL